MAVKASGADRNLVLLLLQAFDPRVAAPVSLGRNGGLLDTVRLPSAGEYALLVDPRN